jgi:hypothetical protein
MQVSTVSWLSFFFPFLVDLGAVCLPNTNPKIKSGPTLNLKPCFLWRRRLVDAKVLTLPNTFTTTDTGESCQRYPSFALRLVQIRTSLLYNFFCISGSPCMCKLHVCLGWNITIVLFCFNVIYEKKNDYFSKLYAKKQANVNTTVFV